MPPKTYSWGPVRWIWSCSKEISPFLSYLDRDNADACGVKTQGFPLHRKASQKSLIAWG